VLRSSFFVLRDWQSDGLLVEPIRNRCVSGL
ncbi:MAG: hypothetical protein ACI8XZ_003577, partial [Gammaproteobacteria bacterium]